MTSNIAPRKGDTNGDRLILKCDGPNDYRGLYVTYTSKGEVEIKCQNCSRQHTLLLEAS